MKLIYEHIEGEPFRIRYPKDFKKCAEQISPSEIIYDRWRKIARCMHCGETWDYVTPYHADKFIHCPYCKQYATLWPHTRGRLVKYRKMLIFWNYREQLRFAHLIIKWKYQGEPVDQIPHDLYIELEEVGRITPKVQEIWSVRACWDYHAREWNNLKWRSEPAKLRIDAQNINSELTEIHAEAADIIARSFLSRCGIDTRGQWGDSLLRELTLHARYPAAEYVVKAGLGDLITAKIYRTATYIRPNWKAKTIDKFLGISHQDIDKLKSWGCWQSMDSIALYKLIRKTRGKVTKNQMDIVKHVFGDVATYMYYAKGLDIVKAARYVNKQDRQQEGQNNFCHSYIPQTCMSLYKDYLGELRELGYPQDEYYLYPKDLRAAHERTSAEMRERRERERQEFLRIQRMENDEKEEHFREKMLPKLKKYEYSDDEFCIRPLESYEDFRLEGMNNKNCVGGYWERAVRGKTKIFVMRHTSTPDVSCITIELSPNEKELLQCYRTGNRLPAPEEQAWAEEWLHNIVQRGGQICRTAS